MAAARVKRSQPASCHRIYDLKPYQRPGLCGLSLDALSPRRLSFLKACLFKFRFGSEPPLRVQRRQHTPQPLHARPLVPTHLLQHPRVPFHPAPPKPPPTHPPPVSHPPPPPTSPPRAPTLTIKSICAVPLSTHSPLTRSPPNSDSAPGPVGSTSLTWKSGPRPTLRSGRNSSTSRSNGTSWCAYAPSAASRTRPSSSRNVTPARTPTRSTSWLTKNPMSPSVSGRVRFATSVPTTISSRPL